MYAAAPSIAAMNVAGDANWRLEVPLTSLGTPNGSIKSPAAAAGRTMTAWFARVPYQGMRPRISRSSVVPSRATQVPAAGPPKTVAARIVDTDTVNWAPRGILIGTADATSVAATQKSRLAYGAQ